MPTNSASRLVALDWMRGFVMLLMTIDHASDFFNAEIVSQDSYLLGAAGADLAPNGSVVPFLTRWITHLCAPTFVFLAGAALALSIERRQLAGASARQVDRHLLLRGGILIALELWMALAFKFPLLQVLYAIGLSLCCMVWLRRLPIFALVGIAIGWLVLGEGLVEGLGLKPVPNPDGWPPPHVPLWATLTLLPSIWSTGIPINLGFTQLWPLAGCMYPLLGWLAIMMLGWAFGRWLLQQHDAAAPLESRAIRLLLLWGIAALLVFAAQRLGNGYGNYWLDRTDGSWLRWLQVSKYPVSLAYAALELGLMACCLAGCFWLQARVQASDRNPVLVLGQTALFYYLLHAHILALAAGALGSGLAAPRFGVESAWIAATLVSLALWPVCARYRAYKRAHAGGWTRFV